MTILHYLYFTEEQLNEMSEKCLSVGKDFEEIMQNFSDKYGSMSRYLTRDDFICFMKANLYGLINE